MNNTLQIFPVDIERDMDRVAEIMNTSNPMQMSGADLLDDFRRLPSDTSFCFRKAVTEDGQIIGVSAAIEMRPGSGRYRFNLVVEPKLREQGFGSRLFDDQTAWLREHSANRLDTSVRDDDPAALRFAERRGFAINRHIFDSILDVQAFDETPFAGTIEAVERSGIRFFTYAEAGDTPDSRRRTYDILLPIQADIPGMDMPVPPYEDFVRSEIESPLFFKEGSYYAADGDRWIGFAALFWMREANLIVHALTGVLPEYRGRKIALALKLLNIRAAKARGVPHIRTNNDEMNAPMLAINRKLGYIPVPGFYRMMKVV